MEGQKHKKKEAAQKTGAPPVPKGGPVGLRCELCDVTCTGSDAYAAHIRGAKHQKVVKLHTKLGKPIPSDSPTVIAPSPSNHSSSYNNTVTKIAAPPTPITGNGVASGMGNNFAKPIAPKISFVANPAAVAVGGSVTTVPVPEKKVDEQQASAVVAPMSTTYTSPAAPGGNISSPDYIEKDVQPVGQDYIEEIRNDEGTPFFPFCK